MTALRDHYCWPLLVAGIFRCTCAAHFWQPCVTVALAKERAR